MEVKPIEATILELFEQLTPDRQSLLLDDLHSLVEEDDDDDQNDE